MLDYVTAIVSRSGVATAQELHGDVNHIGHPYTPI